MQTGYTANLDSSLVEDIDNVETEIKQAVALLRKNGFEARSITTSMDASEGTKVSIELIIGWPIKEACRKKTIFENSWVTFRRLGR